MLIGCFSPGFHSVETCLYSEKYVMRGKNFFVAENAVDYETKTSMFYGWKIKGGRSVIVRTPELWNALLEGLGQSKALILNRFFHRIFYQPDVFFPLYFSVLFLLCVGVPALHSSSAICSI